MIVLDACAIGEMARHTVEGDALRMLVGQDEQRISCDFARCEVASVFRKIARKEKWSIEEAERYMVEGLALIDDFIPIAPLQREAFRESLRLDHSVYDMYYFVLARRTGATLFTLDRKLMVLCQAHGVSCIAEADLSA